MPRSPSNFPDTTRARRCRAVVPTILTLLFCVAAGGAVLLAQENAAEKKAPSHLQEKQPDKKPKTDKPDEPKDGVVLTGHLSRDSARPDGKIRFWITVENRTSAAIRNLHVADFFTPGFERPAQLSGGCSGASWELLCSSLAPQETITDRKSTRLNSSHGYISYAVFCLTKKADASVRLRVPYRPRVLCTARVFIPLLMTKLHVALHPVCPSALFDLLTYAVERARLQLVV